MKIQYKNQLLERIFLHYLFDLVPEPSLHSTFIRILWVITKHEYKLSMCFLFSNSELIIYFYVLKYHMCRIPEMIDKF